MGWAAFMRGAFAAQLSRGLQHHPPLPHPLHLNPTAALHAARAPRHMTADLISLAEPQLVPASPRTDGGVKEERVRPHHYGGVLNPQQRVSRETSLRTELSLTGSGHAGIDCRINERNCNQSKRCFAYACVCAFEHHTNSCQRPAG